MTAHTDNAKWTYSRYRATLSKNGKFFAIVSPDGNNALSQEDMVELVKDLNHDTANHYRPPHVFPPPEDAKNWSRRYICHFCGFKGRVGAHLRGPVVRCVQCNTATPARLVTETSALDEEQKQNAKV